MWLWNVADPRSPALIAALTGPTGHVYALGLSPDSALLAAGGADSTTRIWTLDPATAVSEICANAGDPITPTEWSRFVPGTPYQHPC